MLPALLILLYIYSNFLSLANYTYSFIYYTYIDTLVHLLYRNSSSYVEYLLPFLLIVSISLNAFQFYIYIISKGYQRPARQQPISNHSNNTYSEILTRNFSNLVTGITSCVETLAGEAYTKKLIPRQVLDQVLSTQPQRWKANILLLAIQDKIEVNPSSFSTFLDVLHSDPALDHLAGILHNDANLSGTS